MTYGTTEKKYSKPKSLPEVAVQRCGGIVLRRNQTFRGTSGCKRLATISKPLNPRACENQRWPPITVSCKAETVFSEEKDERWCFPLNPPVIKPTEPARAVEPEPHSKQSCMLEELIFKVCQGYAT